MDDVIHALCVASKCNRGESGIRAGKGISDELARKRLKKMAKIFWATSALDDIDAIAEFISRDSFDHASLFVGAGICVR